jgi:predicted Zn finger-like uncharacterized protein
MIVPCECGAKLKIDESKIGPLGVKVRCPRCGNILPVQKEPEPVKAGTDRPVPAKAEAGTTVLVAHDSELVRDSISAVLIDAGFHVDTAKDGIEALKKATEKKPKALVLDVGLPGIYGFELCERLKGSQETSDIKIVLVSSVYDMRRYKRTPITLYGADDYIEKHHIQDFLPLKLRKLIFPEQFPGEGAAAGAGKSELPEMARPPEREFQPSLLTESLSAPAFSEEPVPASRGLSQKAELPDIQEGAAVLPESFSLDRSIFQKEECDIPRVDAADPEAVEKARRFARIIVSDIALYNQEAVAEGLRNGTFYELLKADVDEGREIFEKRVPKVIRDQKDYYQEAFDNFIRAQKKNVR